MSKDKDTPETIGYWCLDGNPRGVCFDTLQRPFFIRRWMMRLLLGVTWMPAAEWKQVCQIRELTPRDPTK